MNPTSIPQFVNVTSAEEFEVNAMLTELAFTVFDESTNAWCKAQCDFLTVAASKTRAIPADLLCVPDPSIAGPVFEAARFVSDPVCADLLAGLIAACCHCHYADRVLPSFPAVAAQLSSVDIWLLHSYRPSLDAAEHKHYSDTVSLIPTDAPVMLKQTFPIVNYVLYTPRGERYTVAVDVYGEVPELTDIDLVSLGIGNLNRLGLIHVTFLESMYDDTLYEKFEQTEFCRHLRKFALGDKLGDARLQIGNHCIITGGYQRLEIEKGCTRLTGFGLNFLDVCTAGACHDE
jgi:hypothetical protein